MRYFKSTLVPGPEV